MQAQQWIVLACALSLSGAMSAGGEDQLTPVVVSALNSSTQVFPGTDGKQHVVYELVLTNASATPATIEKIEVVDASSKTLAVLAGKELLTHLRTTANTPVESGEIEFNGTRLALLDIDLAAGSVVPERLMHRLSLRGGSSPSPRPGTPVELQYTVAPIEVRRALRVIGPPLTGKGWVALNGCCEVGGAHRSTGLPVNGRIHFAQRFAIDWMRLDEAGRLVHGDPTKLESYPDYDADVLAVADGTVVAILNTLDDQIPGTLPDPKTITLQNVDGNHIVLDLQNGAYAFYAHLQKGSVRVAVGEHVKRGQVLAKLGNTGNTSGPHLHFHLMDGASVLGSSGLPYVIDDFALAGEIPAEQFAKATGVEGEWSSGLAKTASKRKGEFPMDLNIVNFENSAGGQGER